MPQSVFVFSFAEVLAARLLASPLFLPLLGVLTAQLIAAAILDARTRRFPNVLAVSMALTCLALRCAEYGVLSALFAIGISSFVVTILVLFEVRWRQAHAGALGLGLGDIKFLGALCLWRPGAALVSFAASLCLLACCGVAFRRSSLPLLPFSVPLFMCSLALGVA